MVYKKMYSRKNATKLRGAQNLRKLVFNLRTSRLSGISIVFYSRKTVTENSPCAQKLLDENTL